MFLSSRHELYVLLSTFAGGAVLGAVFDFFRILRKNFKTASKHVWLQDVLMWTLSLVVVYTTLFIVNSAQIRWYEFIGFGAGLTVYMTALSHTVIAVTSAVISFFKKIAVAIWKVIMYPVGMIIKMLSIPFKFFRLRLRKIKRSVRFAKNRIFISLRSFLKKI